MDETSIQSRLGDRLEINPTDYAIETFTPKFKEGPELEWLTLEPLGKIYLKLLRPNMMRHLRTQKIPLVKSIIGD